MANVLEEITDKKTYISEQVMQVDEVYAVYYDGKPINIKRKHAYLSPPLVQSPSYKKTTFVNLGHAKNLAKKLNKRFNTDKFAVYVLCDAKRIE